MHFSSLVASSLWSSIAVAACLSEISCDPSSRTNLNQTTSIPSKRQATSINISKRNDLTTSPDGTCGGNTPWSCYGSDDGPCCSQWGWCGETLEYCGPGCQSGDCWEDQSGSHGNDGDGGDNRDKGHHHHDEDEDRSHHHYHDDGHDDDRHHHHDEDEDRSHHHHHDSHHGRHHSRRPFTSKALISCCIKFRKQQPTVISSDIPFC